MEINSIDKLYQIYIKHPNIAIDTRALQQNDLFFALKGPHFDGNDYALQAVHEGAAYAIVDNPQLAPHDQLILVDDVLKTLQLLAHYHRNQFNIPFIAITGSNGKTTTKELIYAVLSTQFKTIATKGNLNNHIGVPLTLLSIPKDTEIAIIEMGANHIGEIAGYCEIAQPNFGIINNIGKAHLEGFGSLEGVMQAKGELFQYIAHHHGTIFINKDLAYLSKIALEIPHQITYGTSNAQIIGKALHKNEFLNIISLTTGLETEIHTQLIGDYNLPNAMAAICIGNYFKIPIEKIKKAIEGYQPVNHRSQLIQLGSNTIILDAYNANPASMHAAIHNFALQNSAETKWILLGAMKELGQYSQQEHQEISNLCQKLNFKNIMLIGKEYADTRHEYLYFQNTDAAIDYLKDHKIEHARILIKGSRGSRMEEMLKALDHE